MILCTKRQTIIKLCICPKRFNEMTIFKYVELTNFIPISEAIFLMDSMISW